MAVEDIEDEAALKFKVAMLELENVIADTAKYEALAWEKVATEHSVLNEDWEERLQEHGEDGVIDGILEKSNLNVPQQGKQDLYEKKESYYQTLIQNLSAKDVLPGIEPLLKHFKKNGVRIIAVSVRKNATDTIEKLEIGDFFDEVISEAGDKPLLHKLFTAEDDVGARHKKGMAIIHVESRLISKRETPWFVVGIGSDDPVEGTDWAVESTSELTYEGLKKKFIDYH